LRFVLLPAALELEQIDVQAARTASAELRRLSVSTPVLEREIRTLPLSTRNVMNMAALAPGIRSHRPASGQSVPAAGALRGERFLNVYLDGVELKNLYDGGIVGFPQSGSPFPADALRELRVQLQPYDPSYARAAAFAIDAVTQRGTNETEATAMAFVQPRGFAAANDFLREVPNFIQPGLSRQQLGAAIRGPVRRDRLFYAASYELSNTRSIVEVVPGRPGFDPDIWNAHAGVFPITHRNHTGLLRLTYTPRPEHALDMTVSMRRLVATTRFGGMQSYESAVRDRHAVHTLGVTHRWLPHARLANELSLQAVAWNNSARALFPQPVRSYPSLTIGARSDRFEIDERHVRIINRLTHAFDAGSGSHVTRAGLELARVRLENFAPIFAAGLFTFESDTATLPRRAVISAGVADPASQREAHMRMAGLVTGLYVSHEWRPVPHLTLSLGLRHDADFGLLNNDLVLPWLADPELAALPALRGYLNDGDDRRNDLDNVSPRFAFSWDVSRDGTTMLRGGAGIIYDRVPGFITFQEQSGARWRTYMFDSPGTVDAAVLRQRIASGEGRLGAVTLVANDMEAPENRQWSIGIGRRITSALTLNADFIHQDVRNLFAEMNLNWLDQSVSPAQRALTDRFGDIVVWDDFARARYRALLAQLTWDPAPDRRIALAYTLGFAEADWDVANRSVPAAAAEQFYVLQRTSGDERHRFVLSGMLPTPFATTLSWIATAASPRPYLATNGQDINLNEVLFDDWIGGRRYLVPTNSWRNWYRVLDVRLARTFGMPGGWRGMLAVEGFNLLNSENYSGFHGTMLTRNGSDMTSFGQPDGVFATRQVQLGLRVEH
ncbi:MAG TPA: TonB-dependent receptor, partial [Longimicrobiales bacterium]|nr:TonB-dependent receptor [Longimicrobiales bacterium]